jgi:hypothetical protein
MGFHFVFEIQMHNMKRTFYFEQLSWNVILSQFSNLKKAARSFGWTLMNFSSEIFMYVSWYDLISHNKWSVLRTSGWLVILNALWEMSLRQQQRRSPSSSWKTAIKSHSSLIVRNKMYVVNLIYTLLSCAYYI